MQTSSTSLVPVEYSIPIVQEYEGATPQLYDFKDDQEYTVQQRQDDAKPWIEKVNQWFNSSEVARFLSDAKEAYEVSINQRANQPQLINMFIPNTNIIASYLKPNPIEPVIIPEDTNKDDINQATDIICNMKSKGIKKIIDNGVYDRCLEDMIWEGLVCGTSTIQFFLIKDEKTNLPKIYFEMVPHNKMIWGPADNNQKRPYAIRIHTLTKDDAEIHIGEQLKQQGGYPSTARNPFDSRKFMDINWQDSVDQIILLECWINHKDPSKRRVLWIRLQDGIVINDRRDQVDPYQLDGFFPFTMPFQPISTKTSVPVPRYATQRHLHHAIQVAAGKWSNTLKTTDIKYLVSIMTAVGQEFIESGHAGWFYDPDMSNAIAMAVKQGTKMDDFMTRYPVEDQLKFMQFLSDISIIRALEMLREVDGISDIQRGNTVAQETATAQRMKHQSDTLRVNRMHNQVKDIGRQGIQIIDDLMCKFFSMEQLQTFCGHWFDDNDEVDRLAKRILKDPNYSMFHLVDVETEAFMEIDKEERRASAVEMLAFLKQYNEHSAAIGDENPTAQMDLLDLYQGIFREMEPSDRLQRIVNKSARNNRKKWQELEKEMQQPGYKEKQLQEKLEKHQELLQTNAEYRHKWFEGDKIKAEGQGKIVEAVNNRKQLQIDENYKKGLIANQTTNNILTNRRENRKIDIEKINKEMDNLIDYWNVILGFDKLDLDKYATYNEVQIEKKQGRAAEI